MSQKRSNQLTGNTGLFYVCYQLSKRGWNCLPTTRNARGVDLVVYSQDGQRKHTIQVKSLSKRDPVPLGNTKPEPDQLLADFLIVCAKVFDECPEVFILTKDDVIKEFHEAGQEQKSYWINYARYKKYKDNWSAIGEGS